MAVLPWLRAIVFSSTSILALVVIGLCAHIESLIIGYQDVYDSFAAFGLVAGSITVVSLPLFLFLGRVRRGAVTSMIVFEIVWFFVLWVLWVGTAGDTVAGRAYYYPDGCIYTDYPATNQICYEITVVEAAAFIIFFSVFIYYDTIVLFAIIQAIRGRGVWTSSIAAASEDIAPPNTCTTIPMAQHAAAPVPQAPYPTYEGYPQNAPPQAYNAYPGQPQNQQYPGQSPNPQNAPPQALNAYPGEPQNPQYPGQPPNAQYPTQPPNPQYPDQPPNPQYYNHPPNSPASGNAQPAYAAYPPSASSGNAPHPPQPNYSSYPANHGQIPSQGGYQEQPHYGINQPIQV